MTRLVRVFALFMALTACAQTSEEFVAPVEPVIEAPVMMEEMAPPEDEALKRSAEVCPQTGDGIGGTGCPEPVN